MTKYAGHPNVFMPVPPGWEDRSQITVVSGTGTDFRANIVLVREDPRGATLREFAQRHIASALSKMFDGFELVYDQPATFGPHHGYLIDYTFTAGGSGYRQRQFCVPVDGGIYIFTFSDTADAFPDSMAVLESVVGATIIRKRYEGDINNT